MVKDLKAGRLSWTIQVGSKHNHMHPLKREAEGDLTHREGDVKREAEIGRM